MDSVNTHFRACTNKIQLIFVFFLGGGSMFGTVHSLSRSKSVGTLKITWENFEKIWIG